MALIQTTDSVVEELKQVLTAQGIEGTTLRIDAQAG